MPVRIQRKRTKGWKMPPNTVYVGRGSRWGNPFKGEDAVERYKWAISKFPCAERIKAWYDAGGKSGAFWVALASRMPELLNMLKGKNLACWCPLDKPCHADVLLKLANKGGKR